MSAYQVLNTGQFLSAQVLRFSRPEQLLQLVPGADDCAHDGKKDNVVARIDHEKT